MRAWLLPALAGVVVTAVGASCTTEYPLEPGVMSFEVQWAVGEAPPVSSEDDPLPFVTGASCSSDTDCSEPVDGLPFFLPKNGQYCHQGECLFRMVVDVQAIGRNGAPFPYRGPVRLRVTPGNVAADSELFVLQDGTLQGVEVFIKQGLGPTHVWFEADGYLPHDRPYGQCNDGVDNDDNGKIDMADPGCQALDDDLEAPVSLATGITPTVYFHNPTTREVQFTDSLYTTPLENEQVRVTSGNLIVVNVVSNGFYVVDLNDNVEDRLYNGMFIFTFSKPQDIDYGDKVCGYSGAVQEFVGNTQVVFPSFEPYYPGNPACEGFPGLDPDAELPDPWQLTPKLKVEDPGAADYFDNVYFNSLLLEKYESNLVSFTDLEVATRYISCDRNDNGQIDSGTPEYQCRSDCQDDPLCTDLESYFEFNQYAAVTAGKKKVYGSTQQADEFKPLNVEYIGGPDENERCTLEPTEDGFIQYFCPPLTLESLTGTLRHIYLCGSFSDESRCDLQFWVIDPRFDGDVKVAE